MFRIELKLKVPKTFVITIIPHSNLLPHKDSNLAYSFPEECNQPIYDGVISGIDGTRTHIPFRPPVTGESATFATTIPLVENIRFERPLRFPNSVCYLTTPYSRNILNFF